VSQPLALAGELRPPRLNTLGTWHDAQPHRVMVWRGLEVAVPSGELLKHAHAVSCGSA
jgi:hypothetical protein